MFSETLAVELGLEIPDEVMEHPALQSPQLDR